MKRAEILIQLRDAVEHMMHKRRALSVANVRFMTANADYEQAKGEYDNARNNFENLLTASTVAEE